MIFSGKRAHSIHGKFSTRFTVRRELSDARDSGRNFRRTKTGKYRKEEIWVLRAVRMFLQGGVRTFS